MKRIFILLATVAFAASSQADTFTAFWTGTAGDGDYHNAANWDIGAVPANGTHAYQMELDIPGSGPVVTNDVQVDWALLGGEDWGVPGSSGAADVNFTINSGNFSTVSWLIAGYLHGSSGTINMNGGTLTVAADLMIGAHLGGSGTLNMTGGVINTWNLFYAFDGGGDLSQQYGHIHLDGGVINVNGDLITNDRGWINITGGQLNIAGDWAETIMTNQVAWGHIRAYGGEGAILASYNIGTGMTEITATPSGRCHWTDAAGDGDYHNPTNWITAGYEDPLKNGLNIVPANDAGSSYDMFLDIGGAGPVVTNDAKVNKAHLGGAAWIDPPASATNVTFTINSGNYSSAWWFIVGEQYGSHGTVNINGGSLTAGSDLMIGAHFGGSGTLNMNGGVINAGNLFYSYAEEGADTSQQYGHIHLDGGVINVNYALITNERGWIDITGGQLNIAGDWAETIMTNQVAWGHIRAYGGDGAILASYNAGTDMTEITAMTIPICWIDAGNLYWSSSNSNVLYDVEYRTDLVTGTWLELSSGIAAGSFTNSIPLPVDTYDPAFFQVKAYQ